MCAPKAACFVRSQSTQISSTSTGRRRGCMPVVRVLVCVRLRAGVSASPATDSLGVPSSPSGGRQNASVASRACTDAHVCACTPTRTRTRSDLHAHTLRLARALACACARLPERARAPTAHKRSSSRTRTRTGVGAGCCRARTRTRTAHRAPPRKERAPFCRRLVISEAAKVSNTCI
eukprot:6212929-Pleurochrysis_carterae.AAC.2